MKKCTKNIRYVLRTCNANMTSHSGFVWPDSGRVEAPDYEATYQCGHGLHGLLDGRGNGGYLTWADDAKWLIVAVGPDDGLLYGEDDLTDKCKYRSGNVDYCGDKDGALAYLATVQADMSGVVGYVATAGDRGTATAGVGGTLVICWWDRQRYRMIVGYVGEDGIEAGKPYRVDESGKLVEGKG